MATEAPRRAPLSVLLGIGATGAIVLVLQITLTRLLSVTVSYHAAFAVIALVMLGLAASATSVFVQRARAVPPTLTDAANKLLLAAGVLTGGILAFVWLGAVPMGPVGPMVLQGFIGLVFFATFWLCGWVVAFLLAEYHRDVARVYWSDLTGAALGCLITVPLLDVASAQNVALLCALACAASALLLGWGREPAARTRGLVTTGAVAALAVAALVWPGLTTLRVAKGNDQSENLWLSWNHLARITVMPQAPGWKEAVQLLADLDPNADADAIVDRWAMGWGISDRFEGELPEAVWLELDAEAGTQILEDGPAKAAQGLEFIRWDITSAGHHVVEDRLERAFVIGGGGGRDVLTALAFNAAYVRVAELNPLVVKAVDDVMGDYSGRTYSHPAVDLQVGEARGVMTRTEGRFDLIQMSMIDTWASSMSGSMVLSENALYTTEAFDLYYDHLEDDGLLTVSRWYHPEGYGETARMLTLMQSTLERDGAEDPGAHLALIFSSSSRDLNVATGLMKRTPFTQAERRKLREWTDKMGFFMLWPDRTADHPIDVGAILQRDPAFLAGSPFVLDPPYDDRPFFFNTRRPIRSWVDALVNWEFRRGSLSSLIMTVLLVVLLVVGRRLVVIPLQRHEASKPEAERTRWRDHLRPITYFAGIGVGFMCLEIAIMQRYIVYLGHPTYALSVVLFGLLLLGAFGSALSSRLPDGAWRGTVAGVMVGAIATAFAVPWLTAATLGWPLGGRIAVALVAISPLALLMGMMYPFGVRLLQRGGVPHLVPWVWAVNGLCGVVASVLGMMIAISFGYTAVLLVGALAYGATAWAASGAFGPATREG